ncbi:hypothetical protein GCM10010361_46960 [Streptomyces olivaceiscleroticus]|uniref:Uncharacterized protein n=1 Tax=Streptomyces olivaceiscleroticus TaxID=68245 RepID=A0ABN1AI37_9ACTN
MDDVHLARIDEVGSVLRDILVRRSHRQVRAAVGIRVVHRHRETEVVAGLGHAAHAGSRLRDLADALSAAEHHAYQTCAPGSVHGGERISDGRVTDVVAVEILFRAGRTSRRHCGFRCERHQTTRHPRREQHRKH